MRRSTGTCCGERADIRQLGRAFGPRLKCSQILYRENVPPLSKLNFCALKSRRSSLRIHCVLQKGFLQARRIRSSFKPWLEENGKPITGTGLPSPRLRAPTPEQPKEKAHLEWDGASRPWIDEDSACVFSKSPAGGCQVPLGEVPWRRFERRRKRVIPPVEKPQEGDGGYNLQYLILVKVLSQFSEIGIRYSVWHLAGGLGEPQGSPFGVVEFRALLVFPDVFDFAHRNGARSREVRRMRDAILPARRAAHDIHDERLQARIKPAWASNYDRRKLGKGGEEIRIARHNQHAVWHEAHHRLSDLEDRLEILTAVTPHRSNTHHLYFTSSLLPYPMRWPLVRTLQSSQNFGFYSSTNSEGDLNWSAP